MRKILVMLSLFGLFGCSNSSPNNGSTDASGAADAVADVVSADLALEDQQPLDSESDRGIDDQNIADLATDTEALDLSQQDANPAIDLAGLTSLVAPGATLKKLQDGFGFTEGPAADSQGNVYFTDITNNRIWRWSIDSKLTLVRENTGGANGLYFDSQGRLVACEGKNRRVSAMTADKKVVTLADTYNGKKFNSPNDLWIDPKGGIYFSDPRYGDQTGIEQDGKHVYYLKPGTWEVVRVADDLTQPNGLIGTKDGKTLYVADHGANKTWRYTIQADGTLAGKTLHVDLGSDGMTLDEFGNLYLARAKIVIVRPNGTILESIDVPENPANVTFAGPNRDFLFITARTSIYAIRMVVRGME